MSRLPAAAVDPESPAGKLLAALPLNVLGVLAHSPAQMLAFQELGGAILMKGALNAGLRELAILRVGHRIGAAYEVHHHERIGRAVGMTEPQIEAARLGDHHALTADDRLVIAVADAVEDGRIPDDLFARAQTRFRPQDLVELVLAAGFYGMVSRFLVAFDVKVEAEEVKLKVEG
jgi:4-carboxymuconolactone decarboxylase